MGRPSLTKPDRFTRSSIDEESTVEYPRRYPRLGGNFQVKGLPSLATSLTDRPAPVKMSTSLPYRTEKEVQEKEVLYTGESIMVFGARSCLFLEALSTRNEREVFARPISLSFRPLTHDQGGFFTV